MGMIRCLRSSPYEPLLKKWESFFISYIIYCHHHLVALFEQLVCRGAICYGSISANCRRRAQNEMRLAWPVTPRATCWGRGGAQLRWARAPRRNIKAGADERAVARLSILLQRRPPPESNTLVAPHTNITQSEWDNASEGRFLFVRSDLDDLRCRSDCALF